MEEKRVDGGTQDAVCKQCGATFHGNFCPVCGAKNEAMATNGENMDFCPVCGFDRVGDAPFCANCGFAFVATAESKKQSTGESLSLDLASFRDESIPVSEYPPDEEFRYRTKRKDGTIEITGYVGEQSILKVPPTLHGKRVTEIAREAFCGNKVLVEVILSEGIHTVCTDAFTGCSALKALYFPSTMKEIAYGIAIDCYSLEKIVVAKGNKHFYTGVNAIIRRETDEYYVGGTPAIIPHGVKAIGHYAFSGRSYLTEVTIPDTVTRVGVEAFHNCTALTKIVLSSDVTVLNNGTFKNCSSLTEVVLPEGLLKIGHWVFEGCANLSHINLPSSITYIGSEAFGNCASLTEINIPKGIEKLESQTFAGCEGLTHVIIPEGVTFLGSSLFNGCANLKYVVVPAGVTNTGYRLFMNCPKLKTIYYHSRKAPRDWNSNWKEGCKAKISTDTPPCFAPPAPVKEEKPKAKVKAKPQKPKNEGAKPRLGDKKWLKYVLIGVVCLAIIIAGRAMLRSTFGVQRDADGTVTLHIYKNIAMGGLGDTPLWKQFYPNLNPQFVAVKEGVTKIPDYAFEEDSIVAVSLANTVTKIEPSAFSGCNRIYEVKNETNMDVSPYFTTAKRIYTEGGSNISLIENGHIVYKSGSSVVALSYVGDAKTLVIPEGVTQIGDHAYSGYTSFDSITFPDSLVAIGDYAFANCDSLIMFEVPATVTSIGQSAFVACDKLEIASLHAKTLGDGIFKNCSKLLEVHIGDETTRIGQNAFYGCASLEWVDIKTTGWKIYSYGAAAVNGTVVDVKNDNACFNSVWTQYYLTRE